jgi:hypothetical protein
MLTGDCAPQRQRREHRLPINVSWLIICAVLDSLAAIPLPCPMQNAGRSSVGAQIIKCCNYGFEKKDKRVNPVVDSVFSRTNEGFGKKSLIALDVSMSMASNYFMIA